MPIVALALLIQTGLSEDVREAHRLSGHAVSDDESPLEGVEVELWLRKQGESVVLDRARSGADGAFELDTQGQSGVRGIQGVFLTLSHPGLAPSLLDNVFLHPTGYDLGPVVLYPPVQVRGRVLDEEGRPVSGAEIHAALGKVVAPHADHARRAPVAVTDANGEYACRSLPPGIVTLGASAPGLADRVLEPLELGAEPANVVDFTLAPARRVSLHVTSEGRALSEARAEPLGNLYGGEPWAEPHEYCAFWRGALTADAGGRILVPGVAETFAGDVRVHAPGFQPVLVSLATSEVEVELAPVTWIEVVAASRDGSPPPELHRVVVRDTTREPSWCGTCDQSRLAWLWRDSPAVERLAPERWRIAWNGLDCYLDGGPPGTLSATTSIGSRAYADLEGTSGSHRACRLVFEPPARLSGVVRTADGTPVSLRLGVEVDFGESEPLLTTSGRDGRFEFERIGHGARTLYAADMHWDVNADSEEIELEAGGSSEVVVIVHPLARTSGRVRGRLLIAGSAPGKPVMLALGSPPNDLTWTDAEGRFEVGSSRPGVYELVPKHTPRPGGYRDFAAEFPAHSRWKWKVRIPTEGMAEDVIHFPPEEEWDSHAPPRAKR